MIWGGSFLSRQRHSVTRDPQSTIATRMSCDERGEAWEQRKRDKYSIITIIIIMVRMFQDRHQTQDMT